MRGYPTFWSTWSKYLTNPLLRLIQRHEYTGSTAATASATDLLEVTQRFEKTQDMVASLTRTSLPFP